MRRNKQTRISKPDAPFSLMVYFPLIAKLINLVSTAKVMENNPTLMRLKELEALEKVAEKVGTLTVHNGLEGLMKGVVNIGNV